MAAEGKLRAKLKARVEAYGGEIRAVSWLGRRFAPDVLCLFPEGARYFTLGEKRAPNLFIETKAPKGVVSAGQRREHAFMRSAGCGVLVIDCEELLNLWLPPL